MGERSFNSIETDTVGGVPAPVPHTPLNPVASLPDQGI
jgi:hypothetical protein